MARWHVVVLLVMGCGPVHVWADAAWVEERDAGAGVPGVAADGPADHSLVQYHPQIERIVLCQ